MRLLCCCVGQALCNKAIVCVQLRRQDEAVALLQQARAADPCACCALICRCICVLFLFFFLLLPWIRIVILISSQHLSSQAVPVI